MATIKLPMLVAEAKWEGNDYGLRTFENVRILKIGVVPFNVGGAARDQTIGVQIDPGSILAFRRSIPNGWLVNTDGWLYPLIDKLSRGDRWEGTRYQIESGGQRYHGSAQIKMDFAREHDPFLDFDANLFLTRDDLGVLAKQWESLWQLHVRFAGMGHDDQFFQVSVENLVGDPGDEATPIRLRGKHLFNGLWNMDLQNQWSVREWCLPNGMLRRMLDKGVKATAQRLLCPEPEARSIKAQLLMGDVDAQMFPFPAAKNFYSVPVRDDMDERVTKLLRFGVKEDLSGYCDFSPWTNHKREHDWYQKQKKVIAEKRALTSRVYIHRSSKQWSFLFLLRTRVLTPNGLAYATAPLFPEFLYAVPVVVRPEECREGDRTFRGLTLATQQAIWAVPGMSSALSHALNSLKGQLKKMPKPLTHVPGVGYLMNAAMMQRGRAASKLWPSGHSVCWPYGGAGNAPGVWQINTADGAHQRLDVRRSLREIWGNSESNRLVQEVESVQPVSKLARAVTLEDSPTDALLIHETTRHRIRRKLRLT
jgi:hypothetical protein